jgi:DNA-binding NarL/FixJ family response regulator
LTLEQAVDDALAAEPPVPPATGPATMAPSTPPGILSRREREVATLIAHGLTNREIAEALVISELTADTHVRHILRKLGVRSRAQVATWVTEQGQPAPNPD